MLLLKNQKKLFPAFHPQTDDQKERQNSIIEAYLRTFINWDQEAWAKLLAMIEFDNNNAKNVSIGHILFEFNYGYQPKVSFKEDVDPRLRSCCIVKLAEELKELIEVCCSNLFHR